MSQPLYTFFKAPDLAVANLGKVVTVTCQGTTWVKEYPHTYQAEDLCQALMKAQDHTKIIQELPLYGFKRIQS
jgi:hypothetical protein